MVRTGAKQKHTKLCDDNELHYIIRDMGNAMRNASKEYIARSTSIVALTPDMRRALDLFRAYCERTV